MRIMLACFLLLFPAAARAQWHATLLAGSLTTHGDAISADDPERPSIRADRPSVWFLAVTHESGAWRVGANARHTAADLAEVTGGSAVATRGVLDAWGVGAEISRRIAGKPAGVALLVGAEVGMDRWRFDLTNGSPRNRLAVGGFLRLEAPVSSRLAAVIGGRITGSPSVFASDELPEGFSARTALRYGVLIGAVVILP